MHRTESNLRGLRQLNTYRLFMYHFFLKMLWVQSNKRVSWWSTYFYIIPPIAAIDP